MSLRNDWRFFCIFLRFVNDAPSQHANTVVQRIFMNGKVYLALMAKKPIKAGTELRLVLTRELIGLKSCFVVKKG